MGLAAGQARLLTITGRKSDCEFESMRLSHSKIALSRELTDLSNEYQNSLEQTKLIYDYYGTGTQDTPLSYGILMTPSVLNDFKPVMLTNAQGRSVLNSKYAAAARAAGIPQEGLGTLPSENVRNAFISSLAGQNIITNDLADRIMSVPYNQEAGFGDDGTTVRLVTKEVNLEGLIDYLQSYSVDMSDTTEGSNVGRMTLYMHQNKGSRADAKTIWNYNSNHAEEYKFFNLGDFLKTNEYYTLWGTNPDNDSLRGNSGGPYGKKFDYTWEQEVSDYQLWDVMQQAAVDLFDFGDGASQQALDYAWYNFETNFLWNGSPHNNNAVNNNHRKRSSGKVEGWVANNAVNYVGMVYEANSGDDYNDGIGVNLSYMVQAYFTYLADYLNGVSATDEFGNDKYKVERGSIWNNKFVTDDKDFIYKIKVAVDVSTDDLQFAAFYDTMFNQICKNGWVENDQVNNNEYVQTMLQSNMMYISKIKDDNYFYQENYATDTYIKEVVDETYIAKAESRYNTEKAKLNAKEQTIDLKMKNLDTEISSLTTEYDTIKNAITKNIDKSFKRYSA